MPRTATTYNQDTPFTDGLIFLSPSDFTNIGAGAFTVAEYGGAGGAGFQYNVAASQVLSFVINLSKLMQRIGFPMIFQEQFGTSNGPGPNSIANTSDPAANQGYPPLAGASQLVPRVGNIPKGIQINNLVPILTIAGAALSLHTIGVQKIQFPLPGTPALAVATTLLANGANGLPTAVNSPNFASTIVPIPNAVMSANDMSMVAAQYNITTGTGTAFWAGMFAHVSFNFN